MRKAHSVLAALVLALAVSVAGCGSAGHGRDVASAKKPSSGKTSATSKLSPEEMGVKFAQCMRDHGIDLDDPEPGKGGLMSFAGKDKSTADKAMQACRKYDAAKDQANKPSPKGLEDGLKMSKCMRSHGVEDFPDPVNGGISLDGSIMEDPDFKKAEKTCMKLIGGGKGELHQEGAAS